MYRDYHRLWYLMILSKKDLEYYELKLDHILEELTKTTTNLKQNLSNGSNFSDKIGTLTASKIDLEEIIKTQQQLLNFRTTRVNQKLEDLKVSEDINDKIYVKKFIEKLKTREIAIIISYTREYTYQLISKIREEIIKIQDDEKENYKEK